MIYCLETERLVLGMSLTSYEFAVVSSHYLGSEDFYEEDHRKIWKALWECIEEHKVPELQIIYLHLKEKYNYKDLTYLVTLTQLSFGCYDIDEYCKMLISKSYARKLEKLLRDSREVLFKGRDPYELAEEVKSTIAPFASFLLTGEIGDMAVATQNYRQQDDFMAMVANARQRYLDHSGEDPFLRMGFPSIDKSSVILRPSNLVVVGGRPSMGKTAFALQIAKNISFKGDGVLFLSFEMTRQQMVLRLHSLVAQLQGEAIERGSISDFEMASLQKVSDKLVTLPLYLNNGQGVYIGNIINQIRRTHQMHRLKMVVVDYFQLLKVERHIENRNLELGEISSRLKQLAIELDIPIILLAQLSRKCEERVDKRPVMSDLRDCGQLEQDADVVMFLHRPSYYNNSGTKDADIVVAKNRHGAIGTYKLQFWAEFGKFVDLMPDDNGQRHMDRFS